MFEKRFAAVAPQLLTSDGTALGQIKVANASLYKVKQTISLQNSVVGPRQFQVQRITDINTIFLGPLGSSNIVNDRSDVSAYTVASGSFIFSIEQPRTTVPEQEIERLTYEEEPTVARRSVLVDKMGNKIDNVVDNNGVNRLAVDGQFHAEVDVQVDVDIDGFYDPTTNPDPDNIGIIGHTRSNPTGQPQQQQRITAIRGTGVDNDNVSQDVSLHDNNGNRYDAANPLPVVGSFEKFFDIVSSSNWMDLATYDQVVPTYTNSNTTLTLAYLEDGALLGEAVINYTSLTTWDIVLKRYIDDDDGTPLLDDDGTNLNLS